MHFKFLIARQEAKLSKLDFQSIKFIVIYYVLN